MTTVRTPKISEHSKLLLLSLMVGVLSGCAACLLDWAIHAIRRLLESGSWGGGDYSWQYLVLPGVGMLIALLLVRFVIRDYLDNNLDHYDYYVVMPHFPLDDATQERALKQISRIPNRKLIMRSCGNGRGNRSRASAT